MKKNQQKSIPAEMKQLAACLTRLRKERGFSIREAARQAGCAASYISKLEGGNTFAAIGLDTLTGLAKAYTTPLLLILKEAGYVEGDEHKLPDLPQYLRLKYRLSHQAIRDMEMAKEIVDRKYGNGSAEELRTNPKE